MLLKLFFLKFFNNKHFLAINQSGVPETDLSSKIPTMSPKKLDGKIAELAKQSQFKDLSRLRQQNWHAVDFEEDGRLYVDNPNLLPKSGLYYNQHFLSTEEQRKALEIVDSHPFEHAIARRQQFWGQVYYHTTHDLASIQPLNNEEKQLKDLDMGKWDWLIEKLSAKKLEKFVPATSPGYYRYKEKFWQYTSTPAGVFTAKKDMPHHNPIIDDDTFGKPHLLEKNMINILSDEVEYPDQILVNEYRNNMGIYSHLDDPMAFGKVLVMISLISPIIMRITRNSDGEVLKILLEPGSLLVMKGEARYEWWHGISHHRWVAVQSKDPKHSDMNEKFNLLVERDDSYRRISLTVRHLLDGRKRVAKTDCHSFLQKNELEHEELSR